MVIKKGITVTEELDEATKQVLEDVLWQKSFDEKEIKQVRSKLKNIKGGSAERTIAAYDKAFKEKGLISEGREDYPYNEFIQCQNLKTFDSRVDPKTIKKTISNMIIQPVTIKQDGKLVTKHALTVNGKYEGYTLAGVRMLRGWSEGWYLKPVIRFMVNSKTPYNPSTGQPDGENKVMGSDKVHTIFVPEDKKDRRKLLESVLEGSDTLPEELSGKLMYRQSDGGRGGSFTFDQYCNLTFEQLSQLQKKAYYQDSKGTLRNTEGQMVQYEPTSGKIQAIA